MSKVITFVAGSAAKTQVFDAASKVVTALGASFKKVSVSEAGEALKGANIAAGSGLTRNDITALSKATGNHFHTKQISTQTGATLNPDTTYDDAAFTVVRSFGPVNDNAIPSVERLDKFPKAGITTTSDASLCEASFQKTAQAAVAAAKEAGISRITVLEKPQTAFKEHNALFLRAVRSQLGENMSVEVKTSQEVFNQAIMFSKDLGVVVSPDYTVSDHLEGIATGISGGAGLASESFHSDSATIFAQPASDGHNPTGLLIAAANALKGMGHTTEAAKLDKALKTVYSSKSTLPNGVQGGSADADAFSKAVVAAL